MARNVEIKARITEFDRLEKRFSQKATQDVTYISQDDTFFKCDSGRLKLREFSDGTGELIFYRRGDVEGPKESFYLRSGTQDPAVLRESLSLAYGEAGRVRKLRTLYMMGRTRVHLDKVEQLGEYIELEVVLDDTETVEDGVREAHQIMLDLGIDKQQLEESAYVDLLNKQVRN